MKKIVIGIVSLATAFTLSACASDDKEASKHENIEMDHSGMNHSSTGEVPESVKVADNPTYEVGSQAILKTDHMEGMKGAEATIVGAYDTIAYIISYTPKSGGERVENHKWVIQEELKDAGDKILEPGTKVTIEADHMAGMEGAAADIDSAELTTVYMVDYTPTSGGEIVKNHKWVTESELSKQ